MKTFRKSLAIILATLILLGSAPLTALSELDLPDIFTVKTEAAKVETEGTYSNNLRWTFDEATKVLTIDCSGDLEKQIHTSLPWSDFKDSMEKIVFSEGLTSMSKDVFKSYSKLVSVTFNCDIKSIGDSAFEKCSNLTEINIPDSVVRIGNNAFTDTAIYNNADNWDNDALYINDCLIKCNSDSSLYSVREGTRVIADNAFASLENLTSVTLPDSVVSIGNNAFNGCKSLESVNIPDSVTSIGSYAFIGTAIYDNNDNWNNDILYIDNCLIKFDSDVTSYTVKEGTRVIADNAFSNFENLTNITLPYSIVSIGNKAFIGCESLEEVKILGDLSVIGDSAFRDCYKLAGINIPESVTEIGNMAFHSCRKLTGVTLHKSLTYIGKLAFKDCYALEEITIPGSVKFICKTTFENCKNLKTVVIKNGVKSIGGRAFAGCTALTSITIPDTVTEIGAAAFYYCDNLESIHIPAGVKLIGKDALKYSSLSTSTAYICSDTENCYANTYAGDNGITFKVCEGHSDTPTEPETVKAYICPDCGEKILGEDEINAHILAEAKLKATIEIKNESGSDTADYGDELILTAVTGTLPEGVEICWYLDGEKVGTGESFSVSFDGGTKTVEAKLVDADGKVLCNAEGKEISDSKQITINSNFILRLVVFFKKLATVISTAVRSIFKNI